MQCYLSCFLIREIVSARASGLGDVIRRCVRGTEWHPEGHADSFVGR